MTASGSGAVRTSADVPTAPAAAFELLIDELRQALARHGIRLEEGSGGGVFRGDVELGRVTAWRGGREAVLTWHAMPWQPGVEASVSVRAEEVEGGSRLVVEHRGLEALLGGPADVTGWFASRLVAPLLTAVTPSELGDWITDRRARRPTGAGARATYRDPLFHRPGFRVLLEELALDPADHLLEVGCGGGALLQEALASGCRASAVDHSPEMVQVARELNAGAIREGRLEVLEGDAASLPFADSTFTCAVMTGVLGFLEDPVKVLAEIRRTLAEGGRLVVAGSDPELRGTPGAPEPFASRLRFYDDDELEALGRSAGFTHVRVVRRDLEAYAREAGIPEEYVSLFGLPSRFLLAERDRAPAPEHLRGRE